MVLKQVLKQALTNTRTMPVTEAPTPIQSIFLTFSTQLPVTAFSGRRNRSITKHVKARIEGTQKTHLQPSVPFRTREAATKGPVMAPVPIAILIIP